MGFFRLILDTTNFELTPKLFYPPPPLSIIFSWEEGGSPPKPPQGFQKNFKGNYAENFFVQKVNALTSSLFLVISLVYWGGQGSWTTLGPFFRRKKMSQKVTKLFSKKKYDFSFFFPKKNYRKKMSQKVTKLFSKKNTIFLFFFKKKLSKKNVVKKKCVFLFFFSKKKLSKKNVTKSDQTLQ